MLENAFLPGSSALFTWGIYIAALFGFDEQPFFESNEGAQDAPAVDFGN